MFGALYISRNCGTSAKSGKEWFQLELIADTVEGGKKVLQTFCTKSAYLSCEGIEEMAPVRVSCGVTSSGYLTVCNVKEG